MRILLEGTPEQTANLEKLISNSADLPEVRSQYFIDNLWSIYDVQSRFDCTEEEARFILEKTFSGEVLNETIYEVIGIIAEIYDLDEKTNNN